MCGVLTGFTHFSFHFQNNTTTNVSTTEGVTTVTPTVLDVTSSTVSAALDLDEILAQDIKSRANYGYSFLAALGFVASCFLLNSFIQTYRAQRRLAWLDCLLWVFCGFQLLLLLLSLHSVVHIPHYLQTTDLGCAALSFFINLASLCGLLVLVLMAYVLTLDPPTHNVLGKPGVCVALAVLAAFLISLLLAGIRGLKQEKDCVMDLVRPGVAYAASRLCLSFLVPCLLQLGLLISGCVRQWKSKGRFLSGSEVGPMFLVVTAVVFFCQLFYGVMLLQGAQLQREPSFHERAIRSVAEFVLFSGSGLSLLLVLLMHRPCRESVHGVFRQLRDCCRSPGRAQPTRNIIAPQIEITETLQDIE